MSDKRLMPPQAGPPAALVVQRDAGSTPANPYGPAPAHAPPSAAGRDIFADLIEYWRIFRKRRWMIAATVATFLVAAAVHTFLQTPIYTAKARIQIDREAIQVLDKGDVSATEARTFDFMTTQIVILQSRSLAERVATTLNLDKDEDFLTPRRGIGIGSLIGSIRAMFRDPEKKAVQPRELNIRRATAIIAGNIRIRPVAGSRLVDVVYSDPNPARAQRIAQAYVEAYINSNIDKRFEANSYAKTFLDDQITQLRQRLESSEQTLLEFAQKQQIVDVSEKESITSSNLAAANAALGSLVSERIRNETLWRQVERADGINLPQLLTNSVIDGLRGKRNALVSEYQEKLQTFKPDYPDMVQLSSKIKEIDRQTAREVGAIKESLKAGYQSALGQENEMKARIETLKAEVIDLQKRSVQYNILKREVDTNRELYNGLLQRFKEVDVAGGVKANNVFIIERAEKPGGPSSPVLSRALIIALGAGLALGCFGAYVIERIDETVHSPEELERVAQLPILGVIPLIENSQVPESELEDPRSGLSEAYRSLATSLQFSTESGLPKTLLVTSSGPGEGKSLTSLAVARHFATMGLKVLLVDADLRNASLHRKLLLDNSIGLTNYLTGACTPPEAFQATDVANLAFMGSGPLPPNAADLLASSRLQSLLSIGLEVFDLIIVDAPPVMGLADAPILSNSVAGTIFVAAAGQARVANVRGSLKRLQLARSPLIGSVITKFSARAAGYGAGYGYGYSYGYGYGYRYGYGHGSEPVAAGAQVAAVRSAGRRLPAAQAGRP